MVGLMGLRGILFIFVMNFPFGVFRILRLGELGFRLILLSIVMGGEAVLALLGGENHVSSICQYKNIQ